MPKRPAKRASETVRFVWTQSNCSPHPRASCLRALLRNSVEITQADREHPIVITYIWKARGFGIDSGVPSSIPSETLAREHCAQATPTALLTQGTYTLWLRAGTFSWVMLWPYPSYLVSHSLRFNQLAYNVSREGKVYWLREFRVFWLLSFFLHQWLAIKVRPSKAILVYTRVADWIFFEKNICPQCRRPLPPLWVDALYLVWFTTDFEGVQWANILN